MIFGRTLKRIARLFSHRGGNVAVIFGIALVPIMAMAGSAIACAIGVLTLYCRGDIVEND